MNIPEFDLFVNGQESLIIKWFELKVLRDFNCCVASYSIRTGIRTSGAPLYPDNYEFDREAGYHVYIGRMKFPNRTQHLKYILSTLPRSRK